MVFSGLGFGSLACAGRVVRSENATSDKSAIDKRKVPRRGMGVLRQAVVVVNPLPCFRLAIGPSCEPCGSLAGPTKDEPIRLREWPQGGRGTVVTQHRWGQTR